MRWHTQRQSSKVSTHDETLGCQRATAGYKLISNRAQISLHEGQLLIVLTKLIVLVYHTSLCVQFMYSGKIHDCRPVAASWRSLLDGTFTLGVLKSLPSPLYSASHYVYPPHGGTLWLCQRSRKGESLMQTLYIAPQSREGRQHEMWMCTKVYMYMYVYMY